jgi:hypothetical protein
MTSQPQMAIGGHFRAWLRALAKEQSARRRKMSWFGMEDKTVRDRQIEQEMATTVNQRVFATTLI